MDVLATDSRVLALAAQRVLDELYRTLVGTAHASAPETKAKLLAEIEPLAAKIKATRERDVSELVQRKASEMVDGFNAGIALVANEGVEHAE